MIHAKCNSQGRIQMQNYRADTIWDISNIESWGRYSRMSLPSRELQKKEPYSFREEGDGTGLAMRIGKEIR
jgi:hypothetical protein